MKHGQSVLPDGDRVIVISFSVNHVDVGVHEGNTRFIKLERVVAAPRVDFVLFKKKIIISQFSAFVVRASSQMLVLVEIGQQSFSEE